MDSQDAVALTIAGFGAGLMILAVLMVLGWRPFLARAIAVGLTPRPRRTTAYVAAVGGASTLLAATSLLVTSLRLQGILLALTVPPMTEAIAKATIFMVRILRRSDRP